MEDRRCDRCSSLTHQFRGLYEGGSPALLRLSVFALVAPQSCSLLEISRKPLSGLWIHSMQRAAWILLCLVKRTLSTLLRFLLDHQEAPTESPLPHCPRLATISPWRIAPPE
ncbi:hypothetical protein AMECASPLE_017528 [Ameca splendens]|uniref:Uncharacterized protein n=1 Tax=Ameca splendens TaxID=208324 RepID=A0ABV1A9X3_9TELE